METPKSRIAFPLQARIARLQSTLAPLPCQSAQAPRDRSPPARLFTQSGELLGAPIPSLLLLDVGDDEDHSMPHIGPKRAKQPDVDGYQLTGFELLCHAGDDALLNRHPELHVALPE